MISVDVCVIVDSSPFGEDLGRERKNGSFSNVFVVGRRWWWCKT